MAGKTEYAASALVEEVGARIGNPTEAVDEFTVRRYLRDLKDALSSAPGEMVGPIFGLIGTCYNRLNDGERALAAYLNAARYDPNVATHESNIAAMLTELGRDAEALEHLEVAVTKPNIGSTLRIILLAQAARLNRKLGNDVAARAAFDEEVRAIDPREALHTLRIAVSASDLGYYDEALTFLARYLLAGAAWDDDATATDVIRERADQVAEVLMQAPALVAAVNAVLAEEDRRDAEELRAAVAEFKSSGDKTVTLDEVLAGHGLTRADLQR